MKEDQQWFTGDRIVYILLLEHVEGMFEGGMTKQQ